MSAHVQCSVPTFVNGESHCKNVTRATANVNALMTKKVSGVLSKYEANIQSLSCIGSLDV